MADRSAAGSRHAAGPGLAAKEAKEAPSTPQKSAKSMPGPAKQPAASQVPKCIQDFELLNKVGEGHMSTVARAQCLATGMDVALKIYHQDKMSLLNYRQVAREIEIHAALHHQAIIKLYAAFEDAEAIYLVQEFAPGGDLYAQLASAGGYLLEDQCAAEVMVPFLAALAHMHQRGIMHRDIKPENMLLSGDYEVRLADFGLAIDTAVESAMARVGTLDYMPPEIVKIEIGNVTSPSAHDVPIGEVATPNYGLPVDVWSAGVLAYELLVGGPPFEADSKQETHKAILLKEPYFPSHLSPECKDFLLQALTKEATKRPTIQQLQRHKWLAPYTPASVLASNQATAAPASQPRRSSLVSRLAAAQAAAATSSPAEPSQAQQRKRRDSHKPDVLLELALEHKLNLGRAGPADSAPGTTPRNTAADAADAVATAQQLVVLPQGITPKSSNDFLIPAQRSNAAIAVKH